MKAIFMFSRKTARQVTAARRVALACGMVSASRVALACLTATALAACAGGAKSADNTLVVSIEPIKYIVDEITGGTLEVEVLTPRGTSPETYEPTPAQIAAAERARLVFSTGLIGFERVIIDRLDAPDRSVDLSEGVALIASDHSHGGEGAPSVDAVREGDHGNEEAHEAGHADETAHANEADHAAEHAAEHANGEADPHIWMSPRALARMAETAYRRIHEAYPDSTSYTVNYATFAQRLATLDAEVSRRLAASSAHAFLILHPGLTYYARDYGLRQIALERDGKEPSAGQLAETVARARAEGVAKVMYQNEFPVRMVEVAAAEIGAEVAEIDILGYDVEGNILKITDLIAR